MHLLIARIVIGGALMVAAWTAVASLAFLYGTGLSGSFSHPFYQWWSYFLFARSNPIVASWLEISGGVGLAVVGGLTALAAFRPGKLGPSLRSRLKSGARPSIRGASDNFGHADWLSIRRAREIFPGPSSEYGGVVVGEAYRVDEDSVAGQAFDPSRKATWGKGGTTPLLIDPCRSGPTHSLVFAGAGSFKSTSAAPKPFKAKS